MGLIVAVGSSLLGWLTLAGTSIWYWRYIVPDFYEDDSFLPFILVTSIAALAYLAILLGAWRRTKGGRDGLPAMILAAAVLMAIVFSTLPTTGMLLVPSLIVGMLAASLPPKRQETAAGSSG